MRNLKLIAQCKDARFFILVIFNFLFFCSRSVQVIFEEKPQLKSINFQNCKHWYLIHTWSDNAFKGSVVNRALTFETKFFYKILKSFSFLVFFWLTVTITLFRMLLNVEIFSTSREGQGTLNRIPSHTFSKIRVTFSKNYFLIKPQPTNSTFLVTLQSN